MRLAVGLVLAFCFWAGSLLPANASPPFACFYRDADWRGQSVCINGTAGTFVNLGYWGMDNAVSSIRVYGSRVTVATGLNGNSYEPPIGWGSFSTTNYVGSAWNDRISSVRISPL